MTSRFAVNDEVWVPSAQVGLDDGFALIQRTVRDVRGISIVVDAADGSEVSIGTRQVHSDDLGFLVVRIGDWATESTLLDPLAKSVLQYVRLLVPEERIRLVHVRTTTELEHVLEHDGSCRSHTIIVGHGSKDGLLLTTDGGLGPAELGKSMRHGVPKVVVSLACYTGRAGFAKKLSEDPACREFVAPFGAVHGAAASTFLQILLHNHMLLGVGIQASFVRANKDVEGTHFVHWRGGKKRT